MSEGAALASRSDAPAQGEKALNAVGPLLAAASADGRWARLTRLWRISACFTDGGQSLPLRERMRFTRAADKEWVEVLKLLDAPRGTALAELVAERPELLGVVQWPYISANWPVSERVQCLVDHCAVLDLVGYPLRRPVDQPITLLEMDDILAGARLVLDQPKWFMREGQLVINLCIDEERVFSIAFSLRPEPAGLVVVVGAVQGRDLANAGEIYKSMTKAFHGLRPRDLLVELLRAFSRAIGAKSILAVADRNRHHRSSYFGAAKADHLSMDYDEVWSDRGGEEMGSGFFKLGVELVEREDVPARKRAMYRRRYDFLHAADDLLRSRLEKLRADDPGKLAT